jgi:hypothetical protein
MLKNQSSPIIQSCSQVVHLLSSEFNLVNKRINSKERNSSFHQFDDLHEVVLDSFIQKPFRNVELIEDVFLHFDVEVLELLLVFVFKAKQDFLLFI